MEQNPPQIKAKQAISATIQQESNTTPKQSKQTIVGANTPIVASIGTAAMQKTRKNKELMIDALTRNRGHVTNSCKLAGISRSTHNRYMQKDAVYRAKAREIIEIRLDDYEATIDYFTLQLKEQPALAVKCAMFMLENHGKERGYGRAGETAVQVNTQINQTGGPIGELMRIQTEYDLKRKEGKNAQSTP